MASIDIQTTLLGATQWARCTLTREVAFLPPLGGNIALKVRGEPVGLFEVGGVYLDLEDDRYLVLLEEVRADGDPPIEEFDELLVELKAQGWAIDGPHLHSSADAPDEPEPLA